MPDSDKLKAHDAHRELIRWCNYRTWLRQAVDIVRDRYEGRKSNFILSSEVDGQSFLPEGLEPDDLKSGDLERSVRTALDYMETHPEFSAGVSEMAAIGAGVWHSFGVMQVRPVPFSLETRRRAMALLERDVCRNTADDAETLHKLLASACSEEDDVIAETSMRVYCKFFKTPAYKEHTCGEMLMEAFHAAAIDKQSYYETFGRRDRTQVLAKMILDTDPALAEYFCVVALRRPDAHPFLAQPGESKQAMDLASAILRHYPELKDYKPEFG